jgi:hypothetical protein
MPDAPAQVAELNLTYRRVPLAAGRAVAPLVLFVAPLLLFGDRLLMGRSLAVGDGILYDLPFHVVVARAIRTGQFPGWNPFEFAGAPLMATGQIAVFYPPNLLFLVMGAAEASSLLIVLSFVVAGWGMFLFARRLTRDRVGALVAAISFSLSGFMVGQVGHPNLVAAVAFLPWTLLGFDLACERLTVPRLILSGGAIALALLAGHAQMYLLIIVVLFGYAILQAALGRRAGHPLRLLSTAGLILLVGIGLSAIQLIPTMAIHGATLRDSVSFATATSFSYSWSHLPLLAFPYLFGNAAPTAPFTAPYHGLWDLTELSAYPGMVALVLAAAGVPSLRRDRRMAALGIVTIFCVLVALGASTPLAHVVYRLPGFDQFRSWARYMVVLDFLVALLAAKGVAILRDPESTERRAALRRCGGVVAGLIGLALLVPHIHAVSQYMVSGRQEALALLLPLGAALIGLGVAVLLTHRVRWAAVLTVLVVFVDMVGVFGLYSEWHGESLPNSYIDAQFADHSSVGFGPVVEQPGGISRELSVGLNELNFVDTLDALGAKGIRSANGYEPLAPVDYLHAVGDMALTGVVLKPELLWPPKSHVLDLLRVTTVTQGPFFRDITPKDPAMLQSAAVLPQIFTYRYYYKPRLPDAFVVGAVSVAHRQEILDAIWGNAPFDPAGTALTEKGCDACDGMVEPGRAGTAHASWSLDSTHVTVHAARPGMLVLSQAWFPGWHAYVDGVPAPVLRVDGIVQGVPVPKGNHPVVLTYEPPGLALGMGLSILTILGLLGAGVLVARSRSRRGVIATEDEESDIDSRRDTRVLSPL